MTAEWNHEAERSLGPGAWYARSPEQVATAPGVDPAAGLSAVLAAELLAGKGPNALPEEKPEPAWRWFLRQYRSYMQIVLVAAVVVSLLIAQGGTAVVLIVLTLLNAVVGAHPRARRPGEARCPQAAWSWHHRLTPR
ncbi:hypothetical protein E0500_016590 [Streptomyces sp. KM273126]|uniref:cation-transporting P-type ATPase n=1 Tax=Streptomyces sp. KM273126 TaxID=2545247 RepID=UPI00103A05F7|nr:cation-transporting P-type ATPase [Streptomyces sp. KM273126]MBA2808973.1 hypothetical protein [Streptomyces sp. KM273126]